MLPGFIVRFRPTGPWRIAPDTGERDRVDRLLHSDGIYSAVTWAMQRLGLLEDWLAAAFRNPGGPAVRFSSCFPCLDDLLFVVPPRSIWPPQTSAKVRWKGARFVPVSLVWSLLAEQPLDEDRWTVDALSECLVPADGPRDILRTVVRSCAAVDRISRNVDAHTTACLEFERGAGMWLAAAFSGADAAARWSEPVKAAFRILADSGLGGRRSLGWGRSHMPEFVEGGLPDLILPPIPEPPAAENAEPRAAAGRACWLLSLFSPSDEDSVDWEKGNYALLTRGGRVESPSGRGALKKFTRMVAEGSVLVAAAPVAGTALDVSPEGFPHPVYRAGFALAVPIPWRVAS